MVDEPRRLAVSESALESGEERIILLHDITDTHRMRLTAERNERLAAMGEMVAGLAHQLRTPLAAALLYTGTLRQMDLEPAQRSKVAERALERLRYLERLIRDMLLFARGDSVGRQRFGVCELAAELAHTLEPLARARQIAFELDCQLGDTELMGDRKALGGALTNLLENAIRYANRETVVDISAVCREGEALVSISDLGLHIDPDDLTKIFERFYQSRQLAAHRSTGIGLSICKHVVERHGGRIWFDAEPERGATFHFSLPAMAQS